MNIIAEPETGTLLQKRDRGDPTPILDERFGLLSTTDYQKRLSG